jgi:AcrR family transcriptional regulator
MTGAGAGAGTGRGTGAGAAARRGAAPGPAPAPPAAPRGRGRPRRTESADTRDRILTAAREEFSQRGFEKASVRGIAKAAGVDPALVHHYFGTKEQVFQEAVETVFAPALRAPDVIFEGPRDGVGERFARFFLGIWENPATRAPLLAVVRSALNNDVAAAVLRRLVSTQLLRRVAAEMGMPDAELRAELAAAQLVGTALLRYVIKVEPLASADVETIVRRIAPAIQSHLTSQ